MHRAFISEEYIARRQIVKYCHFSTIGEIVGAAVLLGGGATAALRRHRRRGPPPGTLRASGQTLAINVHAALSAWRRNEYGGSGTGNSSLRTCGSLRPLA